jgi:hypothetical protein
MRVLADREIAALERVAQDRTLFVDGHTAASLVARGYLRRVDCLTHVTWELTDLGRQTLDDVSGGSDAGHSRRSTGRSRAGGDAAGAAKPRRRGQAVCWKKEKAGS